ncbi:MAG: PadR family transcriptional regulator [Gemmatimonadota bacterium]|jgi:DNA-binding PadR family transcriptional regulator
MSRPTVEIRSLTPACNEVLILTALERGAGHGYQLALDLEERSGGAFAFKHGTLYPILHKLEKEGLIEGSWSDEGSRGRRRRYTVTAKGRRHARAGREAWRGFVRHLLDVIGEEE